MKNKETIMQYCQKVSGPVTAKQIVEACFPGKTQPYVNSTIKDLVQNKKLICNDEVRPYTVRLPFDDEIVLEEKDYSMTNSSVSTNNRSNIEIPVKKFTKADLDRIAKKVGNDRRYGEEAEIIKECFKKFPENVDSSVIAMKIALIDMTNSTNLSKHLSKISLSKLIEKIKNCNFDERVKEGDVSLVGELAENEVNLFSFSSKYCLYHNYYVYNKDDYVIFDGVMQNHVGQFLRNYEYKGKIYRPSKIKNCIEKMRKTYDYEGYLALIDSILNQNHIHTKDRHRKFDWYVWYNNR